MIKERKVKCPSCGRVFDYDKCLSLCPKCCEYYEGPVEEPQEIEQVKEYKVEEKDKISEDKRFADSPYYDLYNRKTNIQSTAYHEEKDRKARKDILNIVLTTAAVLLILTALLSLIARGLITYFFLWLLQLFRG